MTAESDCTGKLMGELGPGSPPKSKRDVVLKVDRVCQATAGPCSEEQFEQPLIVFQGGEEASKEDAREREKRSFVTGAAL